MQFIFSNNFQVKTLHMNQFSTQLPVTTIETLRFTDQTTHQIVQLTRAQNNQTRISIHIQSKPHYSVSSNLSLPWGLGQPSRILLRLCKDQMNLFNIQMTQKNLALELNLTKINYPTYHSKYVYTSMINPKYSQTHRSDKFIPIQFRDKHQNAEQSKTYDRVRDHKSNFSFIQPPTHKKYETTLKGRVDKSVIDIQTKSTDEKHNFRKINKKVATLKEIHPDIPKLRETNSTKCQSPKGNPLLQQHKIYEFTKLKLLGRGKFGDVYLVKHKKTGFIAALKIIRKIDLLCGTQEENQKAIAQLIREIKLQSFLQHPNLIRIYDFFADSESVYLLLELACDGHLFQFLEANHSFSEETTSIIVREIVEGIDYLHKHDIIHRDIKLENIVLSHGMAKICDFGWSVYCPREFRTTLCGTPLYLSPEILSGKHYNKKIDTWAIGALTHELYTGQNPFKIKNKDELSKIITQDFEMDKGSPELRSFVTFILRKNPAKRPDADTIKRHPFIQKYRDLQTSQQLCKLINRKHRQKLVKV